MNPTILRLLPYLLTLLLAAFVGLRVLPVAAAEEAFQRLFPTRSSEETLDVLVLPISGTIDLGLPAYIDRHLTEAEENGTELVILRVDTFGGRVDAAARIRDRLLSSELPIVAFVDRRAISAGALISLAAQEIWLAPGATIGAATPVVMEGETMEAADEKMVSYMRGEMRSTAEARGHDPALAEAMVDRDIALEGVVEAGKLLTLSTEEALKLGLGKGTAADLPSLLDELGLENANRVTAEENWGESLARILTDPAVAGVLMSLAMLGIMIELYSPGFGLPGVVGLGCMGAFLLGHVSADLVGWEEALLIGVGAVLLFVEVFVTPGFGLLGVVGIVSIVAGLILAMIGMPVDRAWELGMVGEAAEVVVVSVGAACAIMLVLAFFLPRRAFPRWLVLERAVEGSAPGTTTTPHVEHGARPELLGWTGEALTDLRLSGKARLAPPAGSEGSPVRGGEVVDVVSLHAWLPRGTPLHVVEVEGARVVVDRIPDSPAYSNSRN
jgi:membrane-bound serine protease (ClpP class)